MNNNLTVVSDLFVNLSAGWIGAGIIIPMQEVELRKMNWKVLIFDLGVGILTLGIAILVRYFS